MAELLGITVEDADHALRVPHRGTDAHSSGPQST
jgi:hypothetical protein